MRECTMSCAPTLATESRHVSLALEPPQFINDNRSTTAGPHDEVEDGLSCCLSVMDGGDAPLSSRVPDHEAAAGSSDLTMHAVTGTFAEPAHESAFRAQLFRMTFPLHVLLTVLCLAIDAFMVYDVVPAMKFLWLVIGLVGVLGPGVSTTPRVSSRRAPHRLP